MYYSSWNGGSPKGDRSSNCYAVHFGGGIVTQRLMQSIVIIKLKISAKVIPRLSYRLIVPQIYILILHCPDLRMGIIELEHVVDNDMLALARLYLRAERMRKEIAELQEACERRQRIAALWASS